MCFAGGPYLLLGTEPIAGHQPVRAYRLDYPGRVRYGHRLRDGPDAGRLSLARLGIWLVSFRWRSFRPLETTGGAATPRKPICSARHPRWHSLDWDVWRARELEQRQADPISRGRRFVHNITTRRPGGNGLGRGRCSTHRAVPTGRLCAIRNGTRYATAQDGSFGIRLEFG